MTEIPNLALGAIKRARSKAIEKEFIELDHSTIAKMSDKDLAAWQSKYEPTTAQWIFAEHEWQNRLLARQVNNSRWLALVALLGSLGGVVIGHLI